MANNIEIKHLRMICAITDSGSMTRAAEKMCLTQSALSQQLRDIEEKLGTALFVRARKKLIVTAAGRQLQDTARLVLGSVAAVERDIAKKANGEKGELKVGTQCIFCYRWLPKLLKHFEVKYPGVEIEIGNSSEVAADLESKRFDLVITGAMAPAAGIICKPLFRDQLVAILPADHPLTACEYLQFKDFANENLVTHAERSKNRFYQEILLPRGVQPQRLMHVGAPQAILELVAAGFGLAVFPRWALAEIDGAIPIAIRPITPKGLPLTWHAAHLATSISEYQQEFIESIGRQQVTSAAFLEAVPLTSG